MMSSLPVSIWQLYDEYLWNYKPDSWIGRIASTYRVLAFLLILPITILTLLDLTSYVIARTLGIIDDVKASTSDKSESQQPSVPATLASYNKANLSDVHPASSPERLLEAVTANDNNLSSPSFTPAHPQVYFTSEEYNLKLSGFGVFSPAASRPPSPTISRRGAKSDAEDIRDSPSEGETADDGVEIRRRTTRITRDNT